MNQLDICVMERPLVSDSFCFSDLLGYGSTRLSWNQEFKTYSASLESPRFPWDLLNNSSNIVRAVDSVKNEDARLLRCHLRLAADNFRVPCCKLFMVSLDLRFFLPRDSGDIVLRRLCICWTSEGRESIVQYYYRVK